MQHLCGVYSGGDVGHAFLFNPAARCLHMHVCAQQVEPQVLEPDKCKAWRWVRWDALPQPLFQPLRQLVGRGWAPPRE